MLLYSSLIISYWISGCLLTNQWTLLFSADINCLDWLWTFCAIHEEHVFSSKREFTGLVSEVCDDPSPFYGLLTFCDFDPLHAWRLSRVSCLLPSVSCLLCRVSCLPPYVSCVLCIFSGPCMSTPSVGSKLRIKGTHIHTGTEK